ncbi:hypothetical protein KAW65_07470 [candidate division WOR-3 bacterium]|nr:hypothetical protein [candidate division WOR-3 bacterium]
MKKIQLKEITIIFLCLLSTVCYSQPQNTLKEKSRIEKLEARIDSVSSSIVNIIKMLESNFKVLSNRLSEVETRTQREIKIITSRQASIQTEFKNLSENQIAIKSQLQSLNNKLDSLRIAQDALKANVINLNQKTGREITSIKKDTLTRFLVVSLAVLFTLLVIIVVVVVFQKKFKKVNVVEESIKLDAKMSEILENQLVLMKKEAIEKKPPKIDIEIDHSLPIRVGAEIFRMRKRIENMDENTKGIHALKNALTRLEDEFNSQGYVIKDLTDQPFVDGLINIKVVNYITRDDIETGKEIIQKMMTPLILHNGVVVNIGEIEVAVSSKDVEKSK